MLFEHNGASRISRVIGLPGEETGIREGRVGANGARLDESCLAPGTRTASLVDLFRVPDGSPVVMGDNREHSNDSRQIGAIPRVNILGRVAR